MKRNMMKTLVLLLAIVSACTYASTIAYWDFEDGVAGQPFTQDGEADGSGGTYDIVNGYMMRGWNSYYGPSFTDVTPRAGSLLASRNADNHQDGYCTDTGLYEWAPETWTIEVSVRLNEIAGWETIIGRDGTASGTAESDFYLQNNGIDDRFRVNFYTVGGQRVVFDSDFVAQTDRWYGLAVTSDGFTVTLLADFGDGNGYSAVGSAALTGATAAENALSGGQNWTFGRGWFNGGFVDHIDGYLDDVRFSDVALTADELIGIEIPEPATMVLLGLGGLLLRRKK